MRRAPALRHAGVVFIRKTTTRARARGGSYTSFRLVESVRSGSQVSQRTLLNLGSGFAVPPERWPELVVLVESLRSGQACLLEPDPALLGEAERIAEALRLRGLDAPAEQAVAVHLDSLEHSRVRSVGCERLELLGLERAKPLSLSKLYRTSDLLWKHREVLKGNVSEPGTLQAAIERLEAQRGAGPLPTVVMDAGLSTEANLAWLRARGYPWITVQRGRAPRPDSAPDAAFATRAGHPVQAWRVGSGQGRAAQLATAIRIEPNGKHPARDAQAGMYVLRKRLAQAGLRSSWETIRRQLAGWVRLTTSLRAADGRWIQCRQDSKAAELAQAIGLAPGLHRMRTSHAADATPSPSSTQ